MSNPTTPFSWQMPTATDLVTDLPADFEVFGQAVATSMADLLGGTTGQVLSKTTNADMDFTWVTTDDTNAIQNSIVDAKGDLIGATAADTPSRLAVGANGTVLTADSAEATGLKWATPAISSFVGCALYNSAAISISNFTVTTVLWNSEDFDTDGFHSTSTNTGRITIPSGKGGKYLFSVTTLFDVNGTGFRGVRFNKNGSVQNYLELPPSSTGNGGVTLNAIYNLVATDYIEAAVEQTSGGALNVKTLSRFQCVYLGA